MNILLGRNKLTKMFVNCAQETLEFSNKKICFTGIEFFGTPCIILFVCSYYVTWVQHYLSGSFAYSCTSSIYLLFYFGAPYIFTLMSTPVDSYNHKHVTSLMKAVTAPFNHTCTSKFKRKDL